LTHKHNAAAQLQNRTPVRRLVVEHQWPVVNASPFEFGEPKIQCIYRTVGVDFSPGAHGKGLKTELSQTCTKRLSPPGKDRKCSLMAFLAIRGEGIPTGPMHGICLPHPARIRNPSLSCSRPDKGLTMRVLRSHREAPATAPGFSFKNSHSIDLWLTLLPDSQSLRVTLAVEVGIGDQVFLALAPDTLPLVELRESRLPPRCQVFREFDVVGPLQVLHMHCARVLRDLMPSASTQRARDNDSQRSARAATLIFVRQRMRWR
jgi:hypothetical protein